MLFAECPWEIIGADLYTNDGRDHLIVVDCFSNSWEIHHQPESKVNIGKSLRFFN